ncbi:hypothetical protein OD350_29375 (plasmid) [Clostridium beijerinckii]|nr:hypothetical protein [Clostridium beijerinckii]UYZ39001.1 hypothetical protein OD350_29375 [Clostridium beijerinckii]
MILIHSIVNDYTTYFAYSLLGGNSVFVYDNGQKHLMSLEQYLKESKIV